MKAVSMKSEPEIVINGQRLTTVQCYFLQAGLELFIQHCIEHPREDATYFLKELTRIKELMMVEVVKGSSMDTLKITPEQIQHCIVGEAYHQFPETTVTICCLTLKNGFAVTGESACASPHSFNEELGRSIARENAKAKIWALEGYLLRQYLHNLENAEPQ